MNLKLFLSISLLSLTFFSFAGETRRPQRRAQTRSFSYGNWVGRMGQTEAFAQYVGISEEQQQALQKSLGKIQKRHSEISKRINKMAREQTKLCRKMLELPHQRDDQVFEKIDEIAKYRSEQAKLAVESLIVLRDTLTTNQYPKARAFFKAEIAKITGRGGERWKKAR